MNKVTACLWFNGNGEQAVKFYKSVIKNVKTGRIKHFGAEGARVSGMPEGSVLTMEFSIAGQDFLALNGGPDFKFTPAVSFILNCKNQAEIDRLWENLSRGGEKMPCGWLTDRFGVTWQVVPEGLDDYLYGRDPEGAKRAMTAFLKMKKILIKDIIKAYKGNKSGY